MNVSRKKQPKMLGDLFENYCPLDVLLCFMISIIVSEEPDASMFRTEVVA
jgi:hypothetical protein